MLFNLRRREFLQVTAAGAAACLAGGTVLGAHAAENSSPLLRPGARRRGAGGAAGAAVGPPRRDRQMAQGRGGTADTGTAAGPVGEARGQEAVGGRRRGRVWCPVSCVAREGSFCIHVATMTCASSYDVRQQQVRIICGQMLVWPWAGGDERIGISTSNAG